MGKKIGGAHMLELRRTKAGIFEENSKDFPLTNLYDFDKAVEEYKAGNDKPLRKIIVPAEIISTLLPVFQLKEEFKQLVLRGSPIHKGYLESEKEIKDLNEGDNICLFIGDNFIGIYTIALSGNILAKPEFVFN